MPPEDSYYEDLWSISPSTKGTTSVIELPMCNEGDLSDESDLSDEIDLGDVNLGDEDEVADAEKLPKPDECRLCGSREGHSDKKCPFKSFYSPPPRSRPLKRKSRGSKSKGNRTGKSRGSKCKCKRTTRKRTRNDENWVRIINLWDTSFPSDLKDVFKTFGPVSRASTTTDRENKNGTGIGFVHFVNQSDAEKAIAALQGYRYRNNKLRVGWAGGPNALNPPKVGTYMQNKPMETDYRAIQC